MDDSMTKALRKSRLFLLEHIGDVDHLLDHVIEQGIFPNATVEVIRAANTRTEKIRRILDHLDRRPHSCFEKFITALKNSSHGHCAENIMEFYKGKTSVQVSDPSPPIFCSPSDCSNPSYQNKFALSSNSTLSSNSAQPSFLKPTYGFERKIDDSNFSRAVQESISPSSYSTQNSFSTKDISDRFQSMDIEEASDILTGYSCHHLQDPDSVYTMESKPRGVAVIFNNENFDNPDLKKRNGSDMDVKRLIELFKFLGFKIMLQADLMLEEMRQQLHLIATARYLENMDCLVVAFLSHGKDGVIFGRDGSIDAKGYPVQGTYLTDEEVRSIFSATYCTKMANKPKLILFQSCRGAYEDTMVDPPLQLNLPLNTDVPSSVASSQDSNASRTSAFADMCFIYSTVSGYVSYRHNRDGSPFIKVMTEVFKEKAATEHLSDMMMTVTRRMAEMELGNIRTIPSITHQLTRKLFFNPGC